MKIADLLPKLIELAASDPGAEVCVFDGVLETKPKTCVDDCLTWQDEVAGAGMLCACDDFDASRIYPEECENCEHWRGCHVGEVSRAD